MTVSRPRSTITNRRAAARRLAGLALAAAMALPAVRCAYAAAGAGAVTLHASGPAAPATLTLRDAGQDPGGRRRFAYELRVVRGACRATLAGIVHRASPAGAAAVPDVEGAAQPFHDGAEGRDLTLAIDAGATRPRYARVTIARAPAACLDWPRFAAEFRAP